MRNETILTKTITKAVEGGWQDDTPFSYYGDGETHIKGQDLLDSVRKMIKKSNYQSVIFSRSFAKAFWKDGPTIEECERCGYPKTEYWKYCLQGMVISEEPLQYLKKFI